jgi:tagatose-1,6-bisphosphate aldolase non-catalytic subunit AgaZ/GatZ
MNGMMTMPRHWTTTTTTTTTRAAHNNNFDYVDTIQYVWFFER